MLLCSITTSHDVIGYYKISVGSDNDNCDVTVFIFYSVLTVTLK